MPKQTTTPAAETPKLHTEGEWKIVCKPVEQTYIVSEDGLFIATVHSQADGKRNEELKVRQEANARRIVTCVNMHQSLIDMVKELKYELRLAQSDAYVIDTETKIERAEELLKQAETK